jgi:mannan endo-1,4-beta-mannosidase
MRKLLFYVGLLFLFLSCKSNNQKQFIKVNGITFEINGESYSFIGANYWFGAILASKGEGGDRERLLKELDLMKDIGINNIRILVGAEGPNGEPFRVTPALQLAPGVYNDTILDGLDFLLVEMKKRQQYAILYLQNSWDWSGGYAQYLNWNGYGPIPYPNVKPNTWPDFINYSSKFHQCGKCKEQYLEFVSFIIGRTNRYSKVKYTDDPTIMTWEIGNEPRAFGDKNIPAFEKWIKETASLIKSIDKNHLVTTGTEGKHGSEQSMELFERVHSDPNIDYLTMHIWPKNWGWLNIKDIAGTLDTSITNTNIYMNDHFVVARKLNKPIVLEEFGLPRDYHGYAPHEPATCRDKYYKNAFEQIIYHTEKKDVLAGCNIWAFGGMCRPIPGQIYWKRGDCLIGDPPCEEQGLNSVYDSDTSTIMMIKEYNEKIKNILELN